MILETVKQTIKCGQCLGCGICSYLDPSVSMVVKDGKYTPSHFPKNSLVDKVCPSKGYNIKEMGESLFKGGQYSYELGSYNSICLAHSNNKDFLSSASSGGIMTAIAAYLLSERLVDGVITTKFSYDNNLVRTCVYIARTVNELIVGQGSKYCPTDTLSIFCLLKNYPEEKYLLIGTPCQIAGFRLLSSYDKKILSQIPYSIANFCGGYRDFKELDYFVKDVAGFNTVSFFRHRGGGQPGSMLIKNEQGEEFSYPYPEYAKLSRVIKNERCTLCIDATGELADFSCGDAWLANQLSDSMPWSIVIARSKAASKILDDMSSKSLITINRAISEQDVIKSQIFNINSKKYRQYKRLRVRHLLFQRSPNWFSCIEDRDGSYLSEIKIMLSKQKSKLLGRK